MGQNLIDHRWQDRILIIQASDELSDKYGIQLQEFKDVEKELMERKLVIYEIVGDEYKMTNYQNKKFSNSWKMSRDIFGDLLNRNDEFRVILIGLDGGVKLDRTTVLKRKDLFNIIDSMPMRMNELRKNRE